MNNESPFVSIVTPVYNGDKYVGECIESVLNQKYDNWEYIIVNNCSTDNTAEILENYANIDSRIRVENNNNFLGLIENHNRAFNLISPYSKYCKVVSSDDTIFPVCLTKMVNLAEAHPTVAIVGSYQRNGNEIEWKGIPQDKEVISGKEICKKTLLEKFLVFGPPTSLLYRSDLIIKNTPFFPNSYLHADTSVFYVILKNNDFGFVHEVLSVKRIHKKQASAIVHDLHIGGVAYIDILLKYGSDYLENNEFERRKNEIILNYYYWLGGCVLKLYGFNFWQYHLNRMEELGYPIRWSKVIKGSLREIKNEIKKPKEAFWKFIKVFVLGKKLE